MPLAVTLRLDPVAAAPIESMWRDLAARGLDDESVQLGYPPHLTLGIWPDTAPVERLDATVLRLGAMWPTLAVQFAGFGVFPGMAAVFWLAPVVTAPLLARQAILHEALGELQGDPHYRPGGWVPHVTLGQAADAAQGLAAVVPHWPTVRDGRLERLELVRFRPVQVVRSVVLVDR